MTQRRGEREREKRNLKLEVRHTYQRFELGERKRLPRNLAEAKAKVVVVLHGFEIGEMSVTASELLGRGKGSTFGELVDRSEEVSEGERETGVGR